MSHALIVLIKETTIDSFVNWTLPSILKTALNENIKIKVIMISEKKNRILLDKIVYMYTGESCTCIDFTIIESNIKTNEEIIPLLETSHINSHRVIINPGYIITQKNIDENIFSSIHEIPCYKHATVPLLNNENVSKIALSFERLLNILKIYDCGDLIRVGNNIGDGGYLVLPIETNTIYSYGIGDNISFEIDAIDKLKATRIEMFDHTIDKIADTKKLIHHINGINWRTDLNVDTLSNHTTKFGLVKPALLKIDVEGCEYTALLSTPTDLLLQFDQIILECHCIGDDIFTSMERKIDLIERLCNLFYLVHIHANNCCKSIQIDSVSIAGNMQIPDVFELTFVNRNKMRSLPPISTIPIPRPIDMVNSTSNKLFNNFSWRRYDNCSLLLFVDGLAYQYGCIIYIDNKNLNANSLIGLQRTINSTRTKLKNVYIMVVFSDSFSSISIDLTSATSLNRVDEIRSLNSLYSLNLELNNIGMQLFKKINLSTVYVVDSGHIFSNIIIGIIGIVNYRIKS